MTARTNGSKRGDCVFEGCADSGVSAAWQVKGYTHKPKKTTQQFIDFRSIAV